MELTTANHGMYAEKGHDDYPADQHLRWFIGYLGYKGSNEVEEEIDVIAKDKNHAGQIAKVVLERDYDEGMRVVEWKLA